MSFCATESRCSLYGAVSVPLSQITCVVGQLNTIICRHNVNGSFTRQGRFVWSVMCALLVSLCEAPLAHSLRESHAFMGYPASWLPPFDVNIGCASLLGRVVRPLPESRSDTAAINTMGSVYWPPPCHRVAVGEPESYLVGGQPYGLRHTGTAPPPRGRAGA